MVFQCEQVMAVHTKLREVDKTAEVVQQCFNREKGAVKGSASGGREDVWEE